MSEYKHTISKQPLTGFAGDPPQEISNAQGAILEQPLTIKNGVVIGLAASAGKRIFTTGFNAAVGQLGNSNIERYINIGTQIGKYILIGAATGGLGVAITGAADLGTKLITQAVDSHAQALENERIMFERGTYTKVGTSGYYG